MNRRHIIYTAMKDGHPITRNGAEEDASLLSDLPEAAQNEVCVTLRSWFEPSNKTSLRHNSYGMKHWLEDAVGYYISNNQLKDAMFSLGFAPSNRDELNWHFKVKPTPELKKYLEDSGRWW